MRGQITTQTIKMIGTDGKEVYPEDSLELDEMSPRFWSHSHQIWMSIPGVTAEEVYPNWLAQMEAEKSYQRELESMDEDFNRHCGPTIVDLI